MLSALAVGGLGEGVQLLLCQSWAAVTFSPVLKTFCRCCDLVCFVMPVLLTWDAP